MKISVIIAGSAVALAIAWHGRTVVTMAANGQVIVMYDRWSKDMTLCALNWVNPKEDIPDMYCRQPTAQ